MWANPHLEPKLGEVGVQRILYRRSRDPDRRVVEDHRNRGWRRFDCRGRGGDGEAQHTEQDAS